MAGIELDLNTADPEQLAKVFEQLENGELPEVKEPDPPPPEAKDAEPTPTENNPAEQDQSKAEEPPAELNEQEAAGVATKDGKHVIPYSVLKSERERASRAEQLAKEMQDRVAALEQQIQQVASQGAKSDGESARTADSGVAVSEPSQEDLEALKEDFPTVYKAVMASMAAAKALESKLKPVEERVQQAEADRERTMAEQVQDAIDATPKLAHMQASNRDAFELAKQFDATLRTQTAWADKPLAERFSKVVEMVEATLGPIELPGQPTKPSQPSAEDLKKAAQAKAAQAAKATGTSVPTSLSEFPVGQPAAQDEREAAEQMTALQLAEKFSSMTPDQMDAYFRTL